MYKKFIIIGSLFFGNDMCATEQDNLSVVDDKLTVTDYAILYRTPLMAAGAVASFITACISQDLGTKTSLGLAGCGLGGAAIWAYSRDMQRQTKHWYKDGILKHMKDDCEYSGDFINDIIKYANKSNKNDQQIREYYSDLFGKLVHFSLCELDSYMTHVNLNASDKNDAALLTYQEGLKTLTYDDKHIPAAYYVGKYIKKTFVSPKEFIRAVRQENSQLISTVFSPARALFGLK